MKFKISNDPNRRWVEFSYSTGTIENVMGRQQDDDEYVIGVRKYDNNQVYFFVQHLKLSTPPYRSAAELPGRLVRMTHEEFSAMVERLVLFRDGLREVQP